MSIVALLILLIFTFYSTKNTISILNILVPYIFGPDEVFVEELIVQEKIELSEIAKFSIKSMETTITVASYIEHIKITCVDFYKNTKLKVFLYDVYHYFRYDFVSKKRFFLKITILGLVILIPLAIYESYEYGFPKEYLYAVPIIFYSYLIIHFTTINLNDFIQYVWNCWFFTKIIYIPETGSWEEYIYWPERKSYFLEKLKIFYNYMSTESLELPSIEYWEDYIYESKHRSIVRNFFYKYIRPKLKWPPIRFNYHEWKKSLSADPRDKLQKKNIQKKKTT